MQVEAGIFGLAKDSRWNEQAKGDGNDQIDIFRRLGKKENSKFKIQVWGKHILTGASSFFLHTATEYGLREGREEETGHRAYFRAIRGKWLEKRERREKEGGGGGRGQG